jgi:hypothetical protein
LDTDGHRHDADLDRPRLERSALIVGVQAVDREAHVGMLRGEGPDEPRDERHLERGIEADRQPAELAARRPPRPVTRALGLCERAATFLAEDATRVGEPDAARRAEQERDADFALERADLPAERRLRHLQPRGGAAEVQFVRDREKVTHVAKLHRDAFASRIPVAAGYWTSRHAGV